MSNSLPSGVARTSPLPKAYAIANSSAVVAVLGVLSPMAGLGLEMVLASTFGRSGLVDAYRSAYLLIGFGSTLFAGFLLPHLVVPVIARYRAEGRAEYGWRIAINCGAGVTLFALALASLVWVNPELFSQLLAPGLQQVARNDMHLLLRASAFGFVVTLWSGVMAGILQIYRSFTLPSSTQVVCNVSILVFVAVLGRSGGARAIAYGVVTGFALMLAMYLTALIRLAKGLHLPLAGMLKPARARELLALAPVALPLLVIVISTIAGSIAVNRALSRLGPGTVAQYGYSLKPLLMLMFVPTALATVIFPSLAEAHVQTDGQGFTSLTARALKMTLLSTAPVACALFCLRLPLLRLLFARGAMDASSVQQTALFFSILLLQAVPACVNSLLLKISFSRGDAVSPAVLAVTQNLGYTLLFPPVAMQFGSVGAMIAIAVGNTVFPVFHLIYQMARYRVIAPLELFRFLARLSVLCGALLLTLTVFERAARAWGSAGPATGLLELLMGAAIALGVSAFLSRVLGIAETRELERYVTWLALRFARRVPA